jgi:hypothetical protein
MDFLNFLKNSSTNDTSKKSKRDTITIKKNYATPISEHTIEQNISTTQFGNPPTVTAQETINSIDTYKNIKRGDFIKIIYQKNSILNCYKGYIGEIKEYRKEQTHALVFLHAINSTQFIKFPLTHFIKYNY